MKGALVPAIEPVAAPRPVCGRTTKAGGSCQRRAGARTNHPGTGACSQHGGGISLTDAVYRGDLSWRYGVENRPKHNQIAVSMALDPRLNSLADELILLRTTLTVFLEHYNPSTPEEFGAELAVVTKATAEIGALLERMERLKAGYNVTPAQVDDITQKMGDAVVRVLGRLVADDATRTKIFRAVEAGWATIRPGAGTGSRGAP